jgi:hypothetical protein
LGFGDSLALSDGMTTDEKDWRQLCALAAVESNPRRLLQIIDQLIEALDRRQDEIRESEHRFEPDSGAGISGA